MFILEIYDLTDEQERIKNILHIQSNFDSMGLYSAEKRNIGKTTIINNLGLEYQALGYEVFIVTPYIQSTDYLATERLTIDNSRGKRLPKKSIILVDEVRLKDLKKLLSLLDDRHKKDGVKILGFVHFK